MKKLLLLFIPLIFFLGCETEEDVECLLYGNWSINYNITDSVGMACFCGYVEDSCIDVLEDCMTFNFFENGEFIAQSSDPGFNEILGEWAGGCSVGESLVLTPIDTINIINTFVIQHISNNHLLCSYINEVGSGTVSMIR